ncbi:Sortase family protein [Actinacidiphila alni]|uniref:Sortase family protein n=1 Tax=Actinacidiphila alni TaxID=380248 RepID=A0A1I2C159_9ACTN|nr:Sortase family protein [Actinacidiphila alni]
MAREAREAEEDAAGRRQKGTLLLVATLLIGAWLIQDGNRTSSPPQPSAAQAAAAGGAVEPAEVPAEPMPRALPVLVRIPELSVTAPLVPLALGADGHLVPPPADRPRIAGWYAGGITPGERGTAIVAGHVDNADGPAVFYALGALRRGEHVDVDRADHSTAVFTVDAVEVYDRSAFPDRRVYGPADRPELRLITCGGTYHAATGYSGNVVVYAHLTRPRPA